jgi:SOS-response transcriptional repressor LexA
MGGPDNPPMPKATTITLEQTITLTTIRNWQHIEGYTPSIRELAQARGKARGSIVQQLKRLEAKGLLRRHNGKARTLEIIQPNT